ncbi:MAG: DnaA regulatory inactivator Hda [Methylomonas sp.]|nr:DnaA regulatory inactivator Hda [Methylomonas sp.]PPD20595.1 MAG: DnaA regulatory inactivator Hda [Methylomonas sp.]PPD26582.1 MAG: DnaA regulatory inactivator Hda [Methylomonas sp.]PPD38377.1 MAG: DnaA regulatory inactivator Hda [Methylomonas sp.]PPD42865.1 MAG: DnaA regulatory inactivator Hda [Methylomonas sp.]
MQETLQFEFLTAQSFDSYFPGSNAEVVAHLKRMADNDGEQQIFIWGDAGCGKSHLLQAVCRQVQAQGREPFYLRFQPKQLPSPNLLDGLEWVEWVGFDDAQHIAGDKDWETALFAFYNKHRQNNHKLLIAADCPPIYLPIELADLKTRMSWGLTLKLHALRDDQLIEALAYKAHFLGFELSPAVGRFLLNHYVHDMARLWQLLDRIDRATLAAGRKLTVPFLKQILADRA